MKQSPFYDISGSLIYSGDLIEGVVGKFEKFFRGQVVLRGSDWMAHDGLYYVDLRSLRKAEVIVSVFAGQETKDFTAEDMDLRCGVILEHLLSGTIRQGTLKKALDTHDYIIRQCIQGKRGLGKKIIVRLVYRYNVNPDYLFGLSTEMFRDVE